jgi:hypothetical protein
MRLLLTRHIHQYRIDVERLARTPRRPGHRLRAPRFEPLTDELTVKTIMLDDQHPLHDRTPA